MSELVAVEETTRGQANAMAIDGIVIHVMDMNNVAELVHDIIH